MLIIFVVAIFSLCADKLCPVLSIINSLRSVCDKFELCELFFIGIEHYGQSIDGRKNNNETKL